MSTAFWLSYTALWVLVLLLIAAVVANYYAYGKRFLGSREGRAEQGREVGSQLDPLVAADIGGHRISLPRPDRPAVFLFAATECAPCVNMRDAISRAIRDGVDTVVVCAGDTNSVSEWSRSLPPKISVIADPKRNFSAHYGIGVTPYGMAVSKDGKVVAKGIMSDPPALEWLVGRAFDGIRVMEEASALSQAVRQ
jgi:hypothetical protein